MVISGESMRKKQRPSILCFLALISYLFSHSPRPPAQVFLKNISARLREMIRGKLFPHLGLDFSREAFGEQNRVGMVKGGDVMGKRVHLPPLYGRPHPDIVVSGLCFHSRKPVRWLHSFDLQLLNGAGDGSGFQKPSHRRAQCVFLEHPFTV